MIEPETLQERVDGLVIAMDVLRQDLREVQMSFGLARSIDESISDIRRGIDNLAIKHMNTLDEVSDKLRAQFQAELKAARKKK